jgi:predicted ATPase
VAGYQRDLEFDTADQALRALGRLRLAEPDQELAEVCARILPAVGADAGLTAAVPEFAARRMRGIRLRRTGRPRRCCAVASRKRPVVVFLDNLQWAGRTPPGFADLVLSEKPVEGLLLVGAYRDGDVDAAHPLAVPPARWRDQATVRHLRLVNMAERSLVTRWASAVKGAEWRCHGPVLSRP